MDARRKAAVMAAVLVSSARLGVQAQDASIHLTRASCPCIVDPQRGGFLAVVGQTFTTPGFATFFTGFTYDFVGEPIADPYFYSTALVSWDPLTNRPGTVLASQSIEITATQQAPRLAIAPIQLDPNMMFLAMIDLTSAHKVDASATTIGPELFWTAEDGSSTYAGGSFVHQDATNPAGAWVNGPIGDVAIDIQLSTVTATPEPATLLLLAPGLVGLGAMARRRRRR